jgi:inorganic pyrophosphatase
VMFRDVKKIQALSGNIPSQIENFFKDYNRQEGKKFTPIRFAGPKHAAKLIRDSMANAGEKKE